MGDTVIAMKHQPKIIEYPKLKRCPFCGKRAHVSTVNLFADTGYRARCSACGVGTPAVIVGSYIVWRGEHGKSFSDDEAAEEAARIWNERAEGGTTDG